MAKLKIVALALLLLVTGLRRVTADWWGDITSAAKCGTGIAHDYATPRVLHSGVHDQGLELPKIHWI